MLAHMQFIGEAVSEQIVNYGENPALDHPTDVIIRVIRSMANEELGLMRLDFQQAKAVRRRLCLAKLAQEHRNSTISPEKKAPPA